MLGTNQIGALQVRQLQSLVPQLAADGVLPGALDKFGLGFAINTGTSGTSRGAKTMSWAGIFNTFFWVDREKQIGAVFLTQVLPFLDPAVMKVLDEFERTVYARMARPSVP
jgi:methyl acetate hydrolase